MAVSLVLITCICIMAMAIPLLVNLWIAFVINNKMAAVQ